MLEEGNSNITITDSFKFSCHISIRPEVSSEFIKATICLDFYPSIHDESLNDELVHVSSLSLVPQHYKKKRL